MPASRAGPRRRTRRGPSPGHEVGFSGRKGLSPPEWSEEADGEARPDPEAHDDEGGPHPEGGGDQPAEGGAERLPTPGDHAGHHVDPALELVGRDQLAVGDAVDDAQLAGRRGSPGRPRPPPRSGRCRPCATMHAQPAPRATRLIRATATRRRRRGSMALATRAPAEPALKSTPMRQSSLSSPSSRTPYTTRSPRVAPMLVLKPVPSRVRARTKRWLHIQRRPSPISARIDTLRCEPMPSPERVGARSAAGSRRRGS